MNIPQIAYFSQKSSTELKYNKLQIQMNDPSDTATADKIVRAIKLISPGISVGTTNSSFTLSDNINRIINGVFYSIISITMFLCFFSLCASMATNLYEQKKEVAILRSMGVTKIRIKLLYFYEALILVVSSCLLGVLIGVIVGYTMSL